jgi:hypothetical protein
LALLIGASRGQGPLGRDNGFWDEVLRSLLGIELGSPPRQPLPAGQREAALWQTRPLLTILAARFRKTGVNEPERAGWPEFLPISAVT